jgi:hypothetical protein
MVRRRRPWNEKGTLRDAVRIVTQSILGTGKCLETLSRLCDKSEVVIPAALRLLFSCRAISSILVDSEQCFGYYSSAIRAVNRPD